MTDNAPGFRSPQLLDRQQSALLVVDVQVNLLPKILNHERLLWNVSRLCRGAAAVGVPLAATEQYPQGLGATAAEIVDFLPERHEKMAFSAAAVRPIVSQLAEQGIRQIVVCGIETHICVLQTALDLAAEGFDVYVVSDAAGARGTEDHAVALERIRDQGLSVVTTEGVLFEWCQSAAEPEFKAIRDLVQESGPIVG
ncbi:isochorismatase family protein [Candidatus Laterigemmans baculatus]|uniref:isochorismatase family protein n=1 Tax=Candidatus Laterigemmans baculatus TaxID=2770505 RepID=UPI0013DD115D|nr:isochorismatase family protein [Candidatus Laterigemmans baculatus]